MGGGDVRAVEGDDAVEDVAGLADVFATGDDTEQVRLTAASGRNVGAARRVVACETRAMPEVLALASTPESAFGAASAGVPAGANCDAEHVHLWRLVSQSRTDRRHRVFGARQREL